MPDFASVQGRTAGLVTDPIFGVKCGEVSGSATAKQLPSVPCRYVALQALADNAGTVYVGGAGVTIPDGTTDTTSGWALAAGKETAWIPVSNLNQLYIIGDNAGDDVSYLALE